MTADAPSPGPAHALLAVKPLARAKSRLARHLPREHVRELVVAMCADTIDALSAARGVASITVVTPDPQVATVARELGAQVLPEPDPAGALRGAALLNHALAGADATLRAQHPSGVVLAIAADLPAVTPTEIDAALTAAAGFARAFVADHTGLGTTALIVRAGPLNPSFGTASAAAHSARGATALGGHWPGLRTDVDTPGDLALTRALGLGRHTRAIPPG